MKSSVCVLFSSGGRGSIADVMSVRCDVRGCLGQQRCIQRNTQPARPCGLRTCVCAHKGRTHRYSVLVLRPHTHVFTRVLISCQLLVSEPVYICMCLCSTSAQFVVIWFKGAWSADRGQSHLLLPERERVEGRCRIERELAVSQNERKTIDAIGFIRHSHF